MSKQQDIFVIADQALIQVVQQIPESMWEVKVPEPLASGRDVTLRELVNYHAYDEIWVPDTLQGKTIEAVGSAHDGDLLGKDQKASYKRIVDTVIKVVQVFPEADLDKMVHLTYGDFPAREYLEHITTFRGFRSYTLAEFIEIDSTMSPELVDGLWDIIVPNVENWRAMGVFGPAVEVPHDADKQTQLLGITGFLQK